MTAGQYPAASPLGKTEKMDVSSYYPYLELIFRDAAARCFAAVVSKMRGNAQSCLFIDYDAFPRM